MNEPAEMLVAFELLGNLKPPSLLEDVHSLQGARIVYF